MKINPVLLLLVALSVLLGAFAMAPAGASGECSLPNDDRCELWSATWDSGRNETPRGAGQEEPADNAVRGRWLYTTGESYRGRKGGSQAFLLKHDTASGKLRWASGYSATRTETPYSVGNAVAVSPDGTLVYVAGTSSSEFRPGDFFVAAFAASDGRRLWSRIVHKDRSWGADVEIVPGKGSVAVAGSGGFPHQDRQMIVARYSSKGKKLWKRSFGSATRDENTTDLAAGGGKLFLTGARRIEGGYAVLTVAYGPDGRRLWRRVVVTDMPGYVMTAETRAKLGRLYSFIVSQDTRQTGGVAVSVMTAMDAADGKTLWTDSMTAPKTGFLPGGQLALSPDGSVAYGVGVPGTLPADHFEELHIRAYRTADGEVLWTQEYDPEVGRLYTTDAVAREDGVVVGAIHMPGYGRDMQTMSFSANDGALQWSALFNPSSAPDAEVDRGSLALSPNGVVFNAGRVASGNAGNGFYERMDVVIAAYD